MANTKGSFTEKEDEMIMRVFKENPDSHVTDIIKKASVVTGRSYSSIYGRYYDKYRSELKKLKS
jgi:hypothetical protein